MKDKWPKKIMDKIMTDKQIKTTGLEKQLDELEKIVSKLENPKTNLDDALKAYESGVKLYKNTKKSLEEAENKMQVIIKELDNLDS